MTKYAAVARAISHSNARRSREGRRAVIAVRELEAAKKVPFADVHAIVAQQRVSSRHMKVEVRQHPGQQIGLPLELHFRAAGREGDDALFLSIDIGGLDRGNEGEGFIDARIEFGKARFVIVVLGNFLPDKRAHAPFATSQAICTWRVRANMSGNSRVFNSTDGSIFFAMACASPFCK